MASYVWLDVAVALQYVTIEKYNDDRGIAATCY